MMGLQPLRMPCCKTRDPKPSANGNCRAEVIVRHRGNGWNTVHTCGLNRRHRGRHVCRKADCGHRWSSAALSSGGAK